MRKSLTLSLVVAALLLVAAPLAANPFKSFFNNLGNTFTNYNNNMMESGAKIKAAAKTKSLNAVLSSYNEGMVKTGAQVSADGKVLAADLKECALYIPKKIAGLWKKLIDWIISIRDKFLAALGGNSGGGDTPPPAEPPPSEPPPAEPPAEEQPPAEEPPAEEPPAEAPPAEDPPAEDPPAEDPKPEGRGPALSGGGGDTAPEPKPSGKSPKEISADFVKKFSASPDFKAKLECFVEYAGPASGLVALASGLDGEGKDATAPKVNFVAEELRLMEEVLVGELAQELQSGGSDKVSLLKGTLEANPDTAKVALSGVLEQYSQIIKMEEQNGAELPPACQEILKLAQ